MTVAEITKGLTQIEYERLLDKLARAIGSCRRFIKIIGAECTDDNTTLYSVKRQGAFNLYVIKEIKTCAGTAYKNMGLQI